MGFLSDLFSALAPWNWFRVRSERREPTSLWHLIAKQHDRLDLVDEDGDPVSDEAFDELRRLQAGGAKMMRLEIETKKRETDAVVEARRKALDAVRVTNSTQTLAERRRKIAADRRAEMPSSRPPRHCGDRFGKVT